MKFEGKTWKFEEHINTDLILPVPVIFMPVGEHAKHVFEANRPGWAEQVRPGEVIVAGQNFGMGSSRPAARSLRLTGLSCLVADSINGLFFRNCVNHGFFAMECPGVSAAFTEGDVAEVDFKRFQVRNLTSGKSVRGLPFPENLLNIMAAGGVLPMLESEGLIYSKAETDARYGLSG